MTPLSRRDALRILAGVPLVLGLGPAAAFAGDGPASEGGADGASGPDGPDGIAAVLAAASAAARPAVIVSVPRLAGDRYTSGQTPEYARRQRTARRLADLLADRDVRRRLVLAQVVVVVAAEDDLAAVALLTRHRDAGLLLVTPADDPKAASKVEPLEPRFDGDQELAGDRLAQLLDERFVGADLAPLRARARTQLARLAPDERERVTDALAHLGSDDFEARERAEALLTERRDVVIAAVALRALTDEDAEVRARTLRVATEPARLRPVGAAWREHHDSGCGDLDPYAEQVLMVKCGMARVPDGPRLYLHLTAGEPS